MLSVASWTAHVAWYTVWSASSLMMRGYKKHPIGKPLIGSFSPAVIAAWRVQGAPSFRVPHRLQSADALGRAGGDSDGRGVDPLPGAAAPAAARVPSKRSGPDRKS